METNTEVLLDFSEALKAIKAGFRVYRKSWRTVDFVFLVKGSDFTVSRPPLNEFYTEGTEVHYSPHIDVQIAPGYVGVWQASQGDMLAEDWVIV